MPTNEISGWNRWSPVFNFLTGLALLATLAFISGCLLEQGAQTTKAEANADSDAKSPGEASREAPTPPPAYTWDANSDATDDSGQLSDPEDLDQLEASRRGESINLAAQYLVGACGENGQFIYKIDLDPAITHDPRYNMLRHAGTIYALGMHHDWHPDPDVKNTIQRATNYLLATSVGTVPADEKLLAIWSRPEITHANAPLQAKLGGAGLGLVALTTTQRIIPGSVPQDITRKLGEFILFMQKPDGSFHSKYIPSEGGLQDNWTSLYYPGEAALGLLMLHELDPDPRWVRGAADTLEYLARTRKGQIAVPADHWALLATAKLFDLASEGDFDREGLIEHALQVCTSIMRDQVFDTEFPLLMGGFAPDGRTTPTATRLEGLIAALEVIPEDYSSLRERIRLSVEFGMAFLNNAQVRQGEHAGAVPRAIMRLPVDGSEQIRLFNRRAMEVRIDYVQHAMSAMIQYVRLQHEAANRTAAQTDS